MPRIKIEVRDGGIIKLETEGFSGTACLAATERVKRALGNDVVRSAGTPEMFELQTPTEDVEA